MMSTRGLRTLLAVLAAAFMAGPAGAAEWLATNDALTQAFRGVTIAGTYWEGGPFRETYEADGDVRYMDEVGPESGTWSVKDGLFCTFYGGMEGGCFKVERQGANCFTFYGADPATGKIDVTRWTARGWNSNRAGDCPTEPEASA